jgi:thiol-disulfide isomerase/thioredoxin
MTRFHHLIVAFSGVVLLGAIAPAVADEGSSELPRYRLKAGQELKYHGTSDFRYENGSLANETDWTVWIVRANGDGGWRLVVRSSSRSSQTFSGQKSNAAPAEVNMAYFDLEPDGRIVPNDSFGYHLDPSTLFPRLPNDAAEAKNGWKDQDTRQDKRTDFKRSSAAGPAAEEWLFDADRHSSWDRIYKMTARDRYVFDVRKGLVKRVDNESTQGYGFNGKGTGTTALVSLEQQEPDRVKAFERESERYFAANQKYQDLLASASKEEKDVNAVLSRAEMTLKAARQELTVTELRDQIDEQLKSHSRMASYYTEEAKNRSAVLGHPAAEWETKDLNGVTHSLKGYRGKVVILDFWYRGCGWCIRAMPQVKELAEEFKGKPVAVLGMNTDHDEKDAKFVVNELSLTYPVLKAEGIPQKYSVRGFPTLIIVDQEGKVADIHVGYSPTLRAEVAKSVQKLLDRQ